MVEKIAMTIEEAAEYTGIGRNTLRLLVSERKIPVLLIGRKHIIRTDALHYTMGSVNLQLKNIH